MKIDNENIDIERIAKLSQLEFLDDDLECIYKDMTDIIRMINELPDIYKDKEYECFYNNFYNEENSNGLSKLRDDIIIDSETMCEKLLKNAPCIHNGFLSIPKTF